MYLFWILVSGFVINFSHEDYSVGQYTDKSCVPYKAYLPSGSCIDYMKDAVVALNPRKANASDDIIWGALELYKILLQEASVEFIVKNVEAYFYRYCGSSPAIHLKLQELANELYLIKSFRETTRKSYYFKWALCQAHYPICIATSPDVYEISLPCREMFVLERKHLPYVFTIFDYLPAFVKLCDTERGIPQNKELALLLNATYYPEANQSYIENCQKAVFPANESTEQSNCYDGNGVKYNGTVSIAKNGMQCVPWRSIYALRSPLYTNLVNNYCRNPQGYGFRPWCYTNSKTRDWAYCDIDKCKSQRSDRRSSSNSLHIALYTIIAFSGIGLLLLLLYGLKRRLVTEDAALHSLKRKLLSKRDEQVDPAYVTILDNETIPNILWSEDK